MPSRSAAEVRKELATLKGDGGQVGGRELTLAQIKRMTAREAAAAWPEILAVLQGVPDDAASDPGKGAGGQVGVRRLAAAYEKDREKRALRGLGRKLVAGEGG